MKHFIKKLIAAATLLVSVFGAGFQTAYAAGSFNPDPSPWGTGILSASIAPTNTMGTANSVNAAEGDIVAFNIYFHNNGNQTINNVKIRFSPQSSGPSTSHTITGTLSGDGVTSITETSNVSVNTSQKLTFIPGSARFFPNQSAQTNTAGQQLSSSQESALVGGSGLNIGSLTAGWPSQGGMVVHYQVGASANNTTNQPQATTSNADNVDEDSATLKGSYAMNGVSGETWFEWGTSSNNLSNDTLAVSRGSNASGSMSSTITGLNDNTTYYFRACVQHNSGEFAGDDFCGSIKNFSTGEDENNTDEIQVTTRPAENIDEDSARLVGDLDEIGSGSVQRWFEWDTNENDVEDGDGNTLSVSGTTNSTGEFNRNLTGLSANRTYYFRACAEDSDGNDDCGNVRSFRTDSDSEPADDRPDVTTLPVVGIGSTFATCNGYYDANGSSTDVWFEWGTTSALGNTTVRQGKGNTEGGMTTPITGLSANTTYFCRAVAENSQGTTYGSTVSFRTLTAGVVAPRPVIVTTGTGTGAFLRLQIENGEEFIQRGDRLEYEVEWENISGRDLENLVIEIDMPDQLVIIDTTEGRISKRDNTVVVNIGTLERGEAGDMVVTTRVRTGRDGDPIVAQATAAFDHPTIEEKTQVNAIAYDSDEYDAYRAGLGASLFGLFDGNILGILLILLLLILIVLIARKQYMDNKAKKHDVQATTFVAPAAPAAPEYRPYRPTPIQ